MLWKLGDWVIDPEGDVIRRGAERRKLERRAMATLVLLIEQAGKVVSKDQMIETIWGGASISDHSVAIVISQLRRELGDNTASPTYIETIPKKGYRLLRPATEVDESDVEAETSAAAPSFTLDRRRALIGGAAVVGAISVGVLANSWLRPRYDIAVADFDGGDDDASRQIAFELTQLVTSSLAASPARVMRWRGATGQAASQQMAVAAPGRKVALLTGNVFVDRGARVAAVQCRDVGNGRLLFTEVYRLQEPDLIAQAALIASEASHAIGRELRPENTSAQAPPEVVAIYWRAQYQLARGAAGEPREGRDMLVSVVERYPNFADAHSALARAYVRYSPETLGLPGFDTIGAARRHLERARAIRGLSGEDATTAALIEFFEARNSDAALRFAEHATRLRASDPTAWQVRALILSVKRRDEEAIQAVLRAQALDPASGDIRWDHVWYLYITGAYRGALAEAEQAEMLAGPYPLYRALIEDALGRPMNAFTSWVARERHHGISQATSENLIVTAQQRGLREGYRALISAIPAARPESGVPLAILQMKAGDPDAAVLALNSPVMARDRWMSLFLDRIPPLASLRSDPRLAGMYARVEDFRDSG